VELSALSGVATGVAVLTGAGTAAGRTITAGTGITVTNGDGVAGNPTIAAAVTSVQGNTGAVIVSVPVTSVQGNTGAVIVTSVSGSAGSVAYSNVQGVPTALSQFSNNINAMTDTSTNFTLASNTRSGGQIQHQGGNCSIGNCGNAQCTGDGNMTFTYGRQGVQHVWTKPAYTFYLINCNCNC
jgi:hypothetical protein